MVGDWKGGPPLGRRAWPASGGRGWPMNVGCGPIPGGPDMIPLGCMPGGPFANAVGPEGWGLLPLGITPLGAKRGGPTPFTPGRPSGGWPGCMRPEPGKGMGWGAAPRFWFCLMAAWAAWCCAWDGSARERRRVESKRTWVYNKASSEPFPFALAVNKTQKTLHHLRKAGERENKARMMLGARTRTRDPGER
jgi:hypothetical protein